MTIASLTDWNARIVMCACCEMPEHPEPRTEFQHRDQQWSAAGWNWANYRAAYGQAMAPGFTAPIPDSLISYRTVSRHTTGTAITAIIYTITAAADAELGLLGSPAPNTEGGTTPLQPYAGSLEVELDRQRGTDAAWERLTVVAPDPTKPVVATAFTVERAHHRIPDCFVLAATDAGFTAVLQATLSEIARQAGLTVQ